MKRSFWDFFSVAEGGRLKDTFLLYSFVLGFVDLGCYLACYALLLGPIDRILPPGMPTMLKNLLETLLPSAVGTGFCLLFYRWVRDKRLVPAGYVWMTVYIVTTAAMMRFILPPSQWTDFLTLLAMFATAPVLLGGTCALLVYWRG